MLKRLRAYYLYAAFPFIGLLVGAAFFHQSIANTITSNPHPQINYAIFAIILFGGGLIIRIVHKLMDEARALAQFSNAVKGGVDKEVLKKMALTTDADIAYVLRMLASTRERSVSHQQQVAIEYELEKVSTRLNARTALPQFLTGLLVGMGLLGTFVGLLATLGDISDLIGSFADMDMSKTNPIDMFRNLIERMKAPMLSMAIAFSASLFGLLGSSVLGLMMVFTRRCLSDILSLVDSEVHQQLDFASTDTEKTSNARTSSHAASGSRAPSHALEDELRARGQPKSTGQVQLASPAMGSEAGRISIDSESNPASASNEPESEVARASSNGSFKRGRSVSEYNDEELRILLRIEDRLSESSRLQQQSLNAEINDYQKQRADMLRVISESTDAAGAFRSELQRVGRQLGSLLKTMEQSNSGITAQISELMIRMSDEAEESRILMTRHLEQQRDFVEALLAAHARPDKEKT